MASKISNAVMTVIYKEKVTINGVDYGSRNETKLNGINEVSQRLMTVPIGGAGSETTLLSLASAASAGTFVRSDIKYIRITNLDNKNFVRLSLVTASGRSDVKILAHDSFVMSSTSLSVTSPFSAFADITSIQAVADTASVDLEVFVASS